MSVRFEDYRIQVKNAISDAAAQFLEEAANEIQSQTVRNIDAAGAVDTGQLKGSWSHTVNGDTVTIGSPLENAIWTELGTGEYAIEGNGRKGGWFYVDAKGKGHFTHGKRPVRMLHNAFESKKSAIKMRAQQIFKELD